MMKERLLILASFMFASSCSSMGSSNLLSCSVGLVDDHYTAIYERDINKLNSMYGPNIDWTHAFSEKFTHEIVLKKIVNSSDDHKTYVRVKEKYSDRDVFMNFSIIHENGNCRIDNYNADEPKELLPDDFRKHPIIK